MIPTPYLANLSSSSLQIPANPRKKLMYQESNINDHFDCLSDNQVIIVLKILDKSTKPVEKSDGLSCAYCMRPKTDTFLGLKNCKHHFHEVCLKKHVAK